MPTGCTVQGNTVRNDTGCGLRLGLDSGHGGNVMASNDAGNVFGLIVADLGVNACDGSSTCP